MKFFLQILPRFNTTLKIMAENKRIKTHHFCSLCQSDIPEDIPHVSLECCCVSVYCLPCVQQWRLPAYSGWSKLTFNSYAARHFAAPCPTCRSPLGLGMNCIDMKVTSLLQVGREVRAIDNPEWCIEMVEVAQGFLFGNECTIRDYLCPSHALFGKPYVVEKPKIMELIQQCTCPRELGALVKYAGRFDFCLSLYVTALQNNSIDNVIRCIPHIATRLLEGCADRPDIVEWLLQLEHNSTWLSTEMPHRQWGLLMGSYARMCNIPEFVYKMPYLMSVLERTRDTGTVQMQENLLRAIKAHSTTAWPAVWLVLSIDSVGSMLDDDMLGRFAGELMLELHSDSIMLGGNMSLLMKVFELNKRLDSRHVACALLIKILDGHDELKDMYKEKLQRMLREGLARLRSPANLKIAQILLHVVDVLADGNAPIICENMTHVLLAALDHKIDITRIFGVVQKYVSTITCS